MIAKPGIDMVLGVADSSHEAAYVADLTGTSYVLGRRKQEWHEHRVFKGARINLNLHVWTFGDPVIDEHSLFRDWLHVAQADLDLYASVKQERLGHADIAMSLNRYSHVTPDMQHRVGQPQQGFLRVGHQSKGGLAGRVVR